MNESAGHIPSTANGCLDYGLCCYPWLVFHGLCVQGNVEVSSFVYLLDHLQRA